MSLQVNGCGYICSKMFHYIAEAREEHQETFNEQKSILKWSG